MEERIEHDSMGEVRVPADRLYGAQTQRSLTHFTIGERMPMEIITALIRIKAAAAQANAELGVLAPEKAAAIRRAAERLTQGGYDAEFPLSVYQTGSGTQTNMNVNEVIAHLAEKEGILLHPNDDVNRGQSTNDVFPSAIHVSTVLAAEQLLFPAMDQAAETLAALSQRFSGLIKLGRTHLMDATPVTLGQEFSGYETAIRRSREMLTVTLAPLRLLALGGTAVGTGLNAHPLLGARTAELLSEDTGTAFSADPNRFYALSCRDGLAFFHGAIKALCCDLMKMASDIRLLASGPRGGFGELILPANEPGSSIMPGKVNPTQCEQLMMAAMQVMGNDTAVGIAASQGQLELNTCLPLIGRCMIQSVSLTACALAGFTKFCLMGIRPDEQRIRAHLDASLMLVTALSPRIGYENAAKIAQDAQQRGVTLKKAALDSGLLSEAEYDVLCDPARMV